jgi:hypothetical protein
LDLRGIKTVPAGWYPNDPKPVRPYRELRFSHSVDYCSGNPHAIHHVLI